MMGVKLQQLETKQALNTSAINLTSEKLLNLTTFIKGQQLNVSLTLSYTKTKKKHLKNLTEN
jgi:hypothetical protein